MSSPLWAERRFGSTCIEPNCGALIPKGKRKCARHLKIRKITQGRASTKGANARGIAAHKPDRSHTRKPKRQTVPSGGPREVSAYRMNPAKAKATKKDRELW